MPCFTFGFLPWEEKRRTATVHLQNAATLLLKCWWYKTVLASPVFQNERCFSASSFCSHQTSCAFIYSLIYLFIALVILFAPTSTLEICRRQKSLSPLRARWCTQLNSPWRLSAREEKLLPTSRWLSIPLSLLNRATCQSDRKRRAEDTHLHSLPPANQPSPASGSAQTSLLN